MTTYRECFEAAVGAYYRRRGKAQGIGKAARQIMQDIQAVQATCPESMRKSAGLAVPQTVGRWLCRLAWLVCAHERGDSPGC